MNSQDANHRLLLAAPSAYLLSGLANWLDYLAPGLQQRGWNVTLGLVEGDKFHRPSRYLEEHPFSNVVTIPSLSGTTEGRRRAVSKIVRAQHPDLVATVNLPDVITGTASLRERGTIAPRIVMTCHGIEPDLYDDMRTYAGLLDGVVCTNRLACKLSQERAGVEHERVHYAAYGTPLPAAPARPEQKDRLTIAFVGRLEQDQKRVHDLPHILDHLHAAQVPFELLIAGSGPEEPALRQALAQHVERGSVRFLGRLSPRQLSESLYSVADVLLMTSRWETGPLVVWEAMAHEVAIVSSRYLGSGLEGALIHGETGLLFGIGECEQAALQLASLCHDPSRLQTLRQAGRDLVRHRYSIEASIDAWHWALKDVLARGSRELSPIPPSPSTGSRLDRVLGPGLGESVRSLLKRKGASSDAGSEWPHSHGTTPPDDESFWSLARRLDQLKSEGSQQVAPDVRQSPVVGQTHSSTLLPNHSES
jgi:glycosyltransferase involved in cell wall biosynthesis